jgi:tetratricopeptide (TPR) repeat protein
MNPRIPAFPTVFALATLLMCTFARPAVAGALEDGIAEIQQEWAQIRYEREPADRAKLYEALVLKAHRLVQAQPNRSEPLIWQGIVVSSLAGEKGGLGALGLAKQAKALYEDAIRIDGNVLDGSAYNSLGVLYYKVPAWPLGFGDKGKARELLQKALAINPSGIDANYFYAEYLVETGQRGDAIPYLERALTAPARAGRQLADDGRRAEARQLLDRTRAN